jgi:hypothetical protein
MGIFNLFNRRTKSPSQVQPNVVEKETPNDNPKSLLDDIVSAWQELNPDLLEPYLSEDFRYNSVWVSNTLTGKENYLNYLRGKFETLRKPGNTPIIDVINEFGTPLLHLKQDDIGVESVLHFDQKDGLIVRMFMRPLVKTTVVCRELWSQYEGAYSDNLHLALQIAGRAIQSYIDGLDADPDFSWLQTSLIKPSFQHLCFRYRSEVYSILIAIHGFQSHDGKDDDGIIVSKQDYDNLLSEAKKNNLIPCIAPVALIAQLPMLSGLNLINAITGELITLENNVEPKQVSMSPWEINSMGVQCVIQQLQKENLKVKSYCDVIGIQPQIFFEMDGKPSYVIVRSIPVGKKSDKFRINKGLLDRLSDFQGYYADVQFTSSSPILKDENGNIVPLSKRHTHGDVWMWRGDGFHCNFNGLQKIHDAISMNANIEIYDDKVYDIK